MRAAAAAGPPVAVSGQGLVSARARAGLAAHAAARPRARRAALRAGPAAGAPAAAMEDPNGFAMRRDGSPHMETVFSPNGTVHTVDLRSPSGILYGERAAAPRARAPGAGPARLRPAPPAGP